MRPELVHFSSENHISTANSLLNKSTWLSAQYQWVSPHDFTHLGHYQSVPRFSRAAATKGTCRFHCRLHQEDCLFIDQADCKDFMLEASAVENAYRCMFHGNDAFRRSIKEVSSFMRRENGKLDSFRTLRKHQNLSSAFTTFPNVIFMMLPLSE